MKSHPLSCGQKGREREGQRLSVLKLAYILYIHLHHCSCNLKFMCIYACTYNVTDTAIGTCIILKKEIVEKHTDHIANLGTTKARAGICTIILKSMCAYRLK